VRREIRNDPEAAIPLLEEAVVRMDEFGFRRLHGRFSTFLGEAYLLRGQLERAQELVSRGLEITADTGYRYGMGWAQHALGRVVRARGRFDEAAHHFQAGLETFGAIQARFMTGRTCLSLAELARAVGDQPAGETHLVRAHRVFTVLDVPLHRERVETLARETGVALPGGQAGPSLAVVRRGEEELFVTLEAHRAQLGLDEVIWDRRVDERRGEEGGVEGERGRDERRAPPPAAWSSVGFFLSP